MLAKYPVNGNFFSALPRKPDSWMWKCILRDHHRFRKGIRWKVGDGTNIKFWSDSWCNNRSLADRMRIADDAHLDLSLTVAHFILPTKEWDIVKLKGLVTNSYIQAILATQIPSNSIPDSICWGLSRSGEFTTKSTTWPAHGLELRQPQSWKFSWIWQLDIMLKLKVFLWRLCHASLPTRGNLILRGMDIDPVCCSHYNSAIEDAEYLFLGCQNTQILRQLARDHHWVHIDLPVDPHLKIENWLSIIKSSMPSTKMDRIITLLWSIWKTRNNKIFRNETSSPGLSLLRAK